MPQRYAILKDDTLIVNVWISNNLIAFSLLKLSCSKNINFGVLCPFLGWGFSLLFLVFENFYLKWMLNVICIYWEDCVVKISTNMINYINLFSNIKLTLNSWEEQSLLRMHYFFCVSLGMNCCILLRILVCMFLRDTCPQFTFLVIS